MLKKIFAILVCCCGMSASYAVDDCSDLSRDVCLDTAGCGYSYWYNNMGSIEYNLCSKCPAGTYGDGHTEDPAETCSGIRCAAIEFRTCEGCVTSTAMNTLLENFTKLATPGTIISDEQWDWYGTGATSSDSCGWVAQCPAGTAPHYNAANPAVTCKQCGETAYQPDVNLFYGYDATITSKQTCKACPAGSHANEKRTGCECGDWFAWNRDTNQCERYFEPGTTWDDATKSVVECQSGYYCPGGKFTYDQAAAGKTRETCQQSSPTGALREYINAYIQQKKNETGDFIHMIVMHNFDALEQYLTVGGAKNIGECAFELPENKRLVVTQFPSYTGGNWYHYFNLLDCPDGSLSEANQKVTYEDIAYGWMTSDESGFKNFSTNCTLCEAQFYMHGDTCQPCDILDKLGLDDNVEYEYTGNSVVAVLNEQCAYNFPEIKIEHGVISNMRCHMSCELNSETNGCETYHYQCFVDPNAGVQSYVGCEQGYVAAAETSGGVISSCSTATTASIGGLELGNGTFVEILDPKTMSCQFVKDGCYQELGVGGFAEISNANDLFNELLGTPCPSDIEKGRYCSPYGIVFCEAGYYCEEGKKEQCPAGSYCPAACSDCENVPIQCPGGTYCPAGATAPTDCPSGNYCPAGASAPIPCSSGSYCPEGSSSQEECPDGFSCESGVKISCSAGYYCEKGEKKKCPAGATSDTGNNPQDDTGAKSIADCYLVGGDDGTRICDSKNNCFKLPDVGKLKYKEYKKDN